MTCHVCKRGLVFHGSERVPSSESGCHDGVFMDDDEHAEGWQPDVVYPPCPFNPDRCADCGGSGEAPPDHVDSDDCPACSGSGWKGGEVQWPTATGEDQP